jgi:hypothetical protein
MARDNKRPYKRKCDQCGRIFYAARPKAMYCSGRCKVAAFRERHSDQLIYAQMEKLVSQTNLGKMRDKFKKEGTAWSKTRP